MTETVETILFKAVKDNLVLGALPEIEKGVLGPVTESDNHERISIQCNASDNSDWQTAFGYVYIYVPDQKINGKYKKNSSRLSVLEKAANDMFKRRILLNSDGTLYYKLEEIKKEREDETWSHVITVKLRVKRENFKL